MSEPEKQTEELDSGAKEQSQPREQVKLDETVKIESAVEQKDPVVAEKQKPQASKEAEQKAEAPKEQSIVVSSETAEKTVEETAIVNAPQPEVQNSQKQEEKTEVTQASNVSVAELPTEHKQPQEAKPALSESGSSEAAIPKAQDKKGISTEVPATTSTNDKLSKNHEEATVASEPITQESSKEQPAKEKAAQPSEKLAEPSEKAEKASSKPKEQQPRKRRKRVFKDRDKDQKSPPKEEEGKPISKQTIEEPPPTAESTVQPQPKSQSPSQQPPALRGSQSVHAILEELTTTHEEDARVFSDTSFSKKKENYFQLREWSKIRTEQTYLHMNVIDELQSQLQKAIKASMENVDMYSHFFRERAIQQDRYASHPIINTHIATQSNELSKDVYINCSRLLNSLSDESFERCKRSQALALFIRKNILQDLIEDHIKRTHLELLKIREKVSTAREALLRITGQVDRKITKLAVRYNQYVTKLGYDPNKDFLKGQLSFLRKAYDQTQIQSKLGLLVFDYLKISSDQELKRSAVIKRCLKLYVDGMITAYGIIPDIDSIRQLEKDEESRLIPEFYAVEDLLDDRFLEILKKTLHIEGQDLSMTVLYNYLSSFKFLHFSSRILVLKQYPVIYEESKDKQHNGKLTVSVDNHIHFFLGAEETAAPYPKPSFSFKIDSNLEIKTVDNLTVELRRKEEKRGMLSYLKWSSKNQPSYSIRFLKRDALEEFEEFVLKLV